MGIAVTWENGRQLASITNGANTYSYKYNDEGIRTEKIVNGVTTSYYLEGSKVMDEKEYINSMFKFDYYKELNSQWRYVEFD